MIYQKIVLVDVCIRCKVDCIGLFNVLSNEVHRKTDTLFSGNNTTAVGLEPLTFRS